MQRPWGKSKVGQSEEQRKACGAGQGDQAERDIAGQCGEGGGRGSRRTSENVVEALWKSLGGEGSQLPLEKLSLAPAGR